MEAVSIGSNGCGRTELTPDFDGIRFFRLGFAGFLVPEVNHVAARPRRVDSNRGPGFDGSRGIQKPMLVLGEFRRSLFDAHCYAPIVATIVSDHGPVCPRVFCQRSM